MDLEQIISAAVEKQITELFKQVFKDVDYQSAFCELKNELIRRVKVEFAKRDVEIAERAQKIASEFDVTKVSFSIYGEVNTKDKTE